MVSLTDEILKLRDFCLKAGVREADFWDMTIGEAVRSFKSYEERLKDQAYFSYMNAMTTAAFIGSMFGSKSPPQIYDVYPEYFPKEEEVEEDIRDAKSEANFLKFAQAFNRKFDNGDRKPESENNG